MFPLSLTYVSRTSIKMGYVSNVVHFCFYFLDQNRVCFDCIRPTFRFFSTYLSTMLDLCSSVSNFLDLSFYFLLEIGRPSTVLVLCFDSARPMCRLCSTNVSTVLYVFSDMTRYMFRNFSTCGLTFSTNFGYVLTYSTKIGFVSSVLDLFRLCSALFQLWLAYFLTVFDLCFDCARPFFLLKLVTVLDIFLNKKNEKVTEAYTRVFTTFMTLNKYNI